ncbi:hypothetical protein GWI33_017807 [Rhynchophorus ferrugineus]|nr:hypothetical protein GWI33_017807 [Rhynchophorus ferrugineus]
MPHFDQSAAARELRQIIHIRAAIYEARRASSYRISSPHLPEPSSLMIIQIDRFIYSRSGSERYKLILAREMNVVTLYHINSDVFLFAYFGSSRISFNNKKK